MIIREFLKDRLGSDFPDIHLLDIGCSGGIGSEFDAFGDHLVAVGVDPLQAEVERLNQLNENPKIHYMDAWIEWPDWERVYPPADRGRFSTQPAKRLSYSAAITGSGLDYKKERYNNNKEVVYSANKLELDELIPEFPDQRIDFLKTDTDGFDFPVLKSGQKMLSGHNVLMAKVEANLHGDIHQYANNFANIDGYMRRMGLSLLDFQTYRYSRSVLPDRFCYDFPAQTLSGQVQWGDAFYFRDFCNPAFTKTFNWQPDRNDVVRLLVLLERFKYPDVAAELLIQKSDLLDLDPKAVANLLDEIVRKERPQFADSYDQLIEKFKKDYRSFYPIRDA